MGTKMLRLALGSGTYLVECAKLGVFLVASFGKLRDEAFFVEYYFGRDLNLDDFFHSY